MMMTPSKQRIMTKLLVLGAKMNSVWGRVCEEHPRRDGEMSEQEIHQLIHC